MTAAHDTSTQDQHGPDDDDTRACAFPGCGDPYGSHWEADDDPGVSEATGRPRRGCSRLGCPCTAWAGEDQAALATAAAVPAGYHVTYTEDTVTGGGWFADLRDELGRVAESGGGHTREAARARLLERAGGAVEGASPAAGRPAGDYRAALELALEAIDIPHAATVGDEETRARVMLGRVTSAIIMMRAVLERADSEMAWELGYCREQLDKYPAAGYRTWDDVRADQAARRSAAEAVSSSEDHG